MKAVIIDDEPNSSDLVFNLLTEYCSDVKILRIASSVKEGFEAITELSPELVFLDVQMRDGTGFDLLNRFKNINFNIIFITAHHEFALAALKRSAIDYLLKPLSPPDLVAAVKKAQRTISTGGWQLQLRTMLENISEPLQQKQKIVLKTMERIYALNLNEIIRFHSEGSYTEVYLSDGKKIVVSRLLKEFDELLSGSGFLRVHQSHLINTDFIFFYGKTDNLITMKDNSRIPVSTRKKETLLGLLNSI
jgi:two-component system LytT family response regulator